MTLYTFGHTDSPEHFFQQMDFLTPELLRVLQPGRWCVVHIKDRIVPGGINGLGFQTVYRFHHKMADHFEKHGFAYMGQTINGERAPWASNPWVWAITFRRARTGGAEEMSTGTGTHLLLYGETR